MRAHEILGEKWSNWKGLAAYGAFNAAVAGADHAGAMPHWENAPQEQTQKADSEAPPSVTVELPAHEKEGQPAHHGALSKDAKLLALTIWGEARGEGPKGMLAVGHVIDNRMKSDRFGGSVADVVWKPKAFSCWNSNDPNREKMRDIAALPKDSVEFKRWKLAKRIAHEILSGRTKDPTGGALFYHTTGVKPFWADPTKAIARVANHVFYRSDVKNA